MNGIDTTKAAELYNSRYDQFGRDIKTVGWGNAPSQQLRFEVLFRGLDPKGLTILDVGCGLGDLVPYLESRTGGNFRYIGIDVAKKLVEDARRVYGKDGLTFYSGDIFSVDLPDVDVAVLSGALSMRLDGMEEYAFATMRRMYELARKAACLNFLTSYVDYEVAKNLHYQPEQVFSKARQITKYVNLFHDYPLYEFTIQLFKDK